MPFSHLLFWLLLSNKFAKGITECVSGKAIRKMMRVNKTGEYVGEKLTSSDMT